jgi:hypothetical protein
MTRAELETLQAIRCTIPEPTRVEQPAWKFIWPSPAPVAFPDWSVFEPEVYSSIKTGQMERKLVFEEGVSYWAWVYEKVPVFPVPANRIG